MERGEGERLHAQRRKRFWTIIAALALIGFVTGLVGGFAMGRADVADGNMPAWVGPTGTAAILLSVLIVAWGSWRFFVSVDEVELTDNLWASLIGFYAYALLFPAWWALWKLHQLPEPNDWVIFGAVLVIATGAYAYRKLVALRGG